MNQEYLDISTCVKATGFPLRELSKLAVGYSLDELKNDITKTTPASFEPTIDYIRQNTKIYF